MARQAMLYEAMYILDVNLSEEEVAAIDERIKGVVEGAGGKFESVHDFRRRRLAYRIGQHTDGLYRVMYFRGTGDTVDEVKREYGMVDEVVRGNVFVANPDYIIGQRPQDRVAAEPTPAPEAPAEPAEAAPEAPAEEAPQ